MKNVTLTMSITSAEAAKAGVDQSGETTVTVEPSKLSEGARAVYAALCEKTVGSDSALRYGRLVLSLPVPVTAEAVAQWLEANAQDVASFDAQQKASAEARQEADRETVRKWAAKPDKELLRYMTLGSARYEAYVPYSYPDDMKQFVKDRQAKAQVLADQLNAEAAENAAKAAADKAAAAADKAAAAARRADQLAQWLATKGTDSMRKRAARGLLPEDDLIAAIRNEAYAPLDGFKRFERLTDDEVKAFVDAADFDQAVVYETREADSASDEDIELMERMEASVPAATCTLMAHEGKLDDDDQEVSLMRYSVRVEVKVGEFDFSREYATESDNTGCN